MSDRLARNPRSRTPDWAFTLAGIRSHDDSASQCGGERAESAAANEKHCSEHGATADEKKECQPGDREVGEDGTPELVDGRRVEPDE
jgi:hypothetical protein